MKILRRGLPLQTYLSDLNLSSGLSLFCNITVLGGGSDDEDDERGKGSIDESGQLILEIYIFKWLNENGLGMDVYTLYTAETLIKDILKIYRTK